MQILTLRLPEILCQLYYHGDLNKATDSAAVRSLGKSLNFKFKSSRRDWCAISRARFLLIYSNNAVSYNVSIGNFISPPEITNL